jgi:hypothetical protein
MLDAFLAEQGTTPREALLAALASIDVPERLRAGGLADDHVAALGDRLLEPAA